MCPRQTGSVRPVSCVRTRAVKGAIAVAYVVVSEIRFPGESEQYRAARDELLRAEIELRRHTEEVAEQRRALPVGGPVPTDYVFDEGSTGDAQVRRVRLSELFENGTDTVLLYSFMYGPQAEAACPLCTSFIDAIDGELEHVAQRVGFAVVARSPIERLREHARARGWRRARLLSSSANTFNADYHAESADGEQFPLAHVFVRRDGAIRHAYTPEMLFAPTEAGQSPRHIDSMWPLWNVLDLTPQGRGEDWWPQLQYPH
jgi:predicted dithiol-disulfide oxidoreductase (DUF899 family)